MITADSPYFSGMLLDDSPALLAASYRLRYQVYCLERHFLPAENYPAEQEVDAYDRHSVHVGVINASQELAATARLVERSADGLPLLDHCTIHATETALVDPTQRVVEVSRLSVAREYNRRAGDGFYGLADAPPRVHGAERRGGGVVVLTLYKALYQASMRRGYTHWLVATEKSLLRLVSKYGFPFRAIGPETDYYGSVTPYLMDLQEFGDIIMGGRTPLLSSFLNGLEPEFRPVDHKIRPPSEQADDCVPITD